MNERTQRMNTHHVPAARSLRRARRDAVGVLQRHARGWMVRREGWWAAATAGMVSKRARKRRWMEHRAEIVASAPAERALLNTVGLVQVEFGSFDP